MDNSGDVLLTRKLQTKWKASSVLNGDRTFRVQNVYDETNISCWNSAPGISPQWITVSFPEPIRLNKIQFMFQGGFVSEEITIHIQTLMKPTEWHEIVHDIDINDDNSLQTFRVCPIDNMIGLKIHFLQSSDFYGRITMYQCLLFGKVMSEIGQ